MNETQFPLAGKKEWIGLAVIALPCFLYAMDLTVLYLAVPHLTAELKPTSSQLLWIVDIYGFLVSGFLITMGTLGDRIGRRKLLLYGAFAFGITSVLAAFSTTPEMLIFTRALLGISAATLAPSTLSLIRNMFHDPAERTIAIGIWGTSFSIGGAIGPLFGGLLLQHYWWGSVFLASVPVMILLLIVGPKLLPEFKDPNAGKLDITSVCLSLVSVLTAIYGIKQMAEKGFGGTSVFWIAVGILLGAFFVRRQLSLQDPLLDMKLFRIPAFSSALVSNFLIIFVALGSFLFVAQYLQLVLDLSPLEAGLWTLPSAIGNVIGSMTVPRIVRFVRPAYVMASGMILAAIGFGLYSIIEGNSGLFLIVTGSFILSLGICAVVILGTDMVVGSAPPEKAGAAASISETATEFGGVLGIAVLGSIGTAVYRNRMMGFGENGDPSVMKSAYDTLGAAAEVSRKVSEEFGSALLIFAKGAFTDSLRLVSVICAGISIFLAFLILFLLKNRNSGAE